MIDTGRWMPEELNNDYEEEWRVVLSSKGDYTLSKNQAFVLRQEIASGNRGTIMFDSFAIAIPYVVEFYRVRRFLKGAKQLPARAQEKPYKPIDKEKWEKFKREIYEKIGRSKE